MEKTHIVNCWVKVVKSDGSHVSGYLDEIGILQTEGAVILMDRMPELNESFVGIKLLRKDIKQIFFNAPFQTNISKTGLFPR